MSPRNIAVQSTDDGGDTDDGPSWNDVRRLYKDWVKSSGYKAPDEKKGKENKKVPRGGRSRAWFMTINNPTKWDFEALDLDDYIWCRGQIEVGEEDGVAHIQCTIYYDNARVRPVKKYPRAFIDPLVILNIFV